jgi:S1-C subfamily serine protease
MHPQMVRKMQYCKSIDRSRRVAIIVFALANVFLLRLVNVQGQGPAAVPKDSPRNTATVRLVQRCLPAVVAVQSVKPLAAKEEEPTGDFGVSFGSGTVVHPAGFILTNHHVVNHMVRGVVQFADGTALPYRIVASQPSDDIALVKVETDKPLAIIPLGHSADLMLGEPALVLGTPSGLAHSVSTGIISGLKRSAVSSEASLSSLVQTTAAVSGGSSGGPLINAEGRLIGVIAAKKDGAENVAFAIDIDRVRTILPQMIAAEQRYGFTWGASVDMLADRAVLAEVTKESSLSLAGLEAGDIITQIDGNPIRHGFDLQLAIIDRQPGDKLSIVFERNGKSQTIVAKLNSLKLIAPVTAKVRPGLAVTAYLGNWTKLPDFAKMRPVAQGVAARPVAAISLPQNDAYGLRFSGYLQVPSDGLYKFYLRSDDGSRLQVDGSTVVDNDGAHPALESAGLLRLKAGLHAMQLDYYEASGDQALQISWEGPNLEKQEIPAAVYFSAAP